MGRLRNDLALVASFLRHGGMPRAVLVTGCTALVSGLLLVALTVVLYSLQGPPPGLEQEWLATVISDENLRAGYVFGLLLICVAPLTLLRQVVRLGTADREQRLAGLRLTGATPAEVGRLAAIEGGVPALAGGLLGYPVFLALRSVFGGQPRSPMAPGYDAVRNELRLIPTSVAPSWWQVLLVVLLVGVAGVIAGAAVTRGLTVSPVGVSRAPRRAPRPWGAVPLLLAVPAVALAFWTGSSELGTALAVTTVALLVIGLLTLTPWVAYRVGVTVAARAATPHLLMAARRLATDARPAGRAAAAVGAIAMVAGFGGGLLMDLPATSGGTGFRDVDPMYTVPIFLVGLVLVGALALVVFSLSVHGAESLVDRKRAIASLAALGTTESELTRVQRWEVGLVALPVTVLGLVIGTVPWVVLVDKSVSYAWIPVVVDLATLAGAWLAVGAATALTRPWLRRSAAPEQLRTP